MKKQTVILKSSVLAAVTLLVGCSNNWLTENVAPSAISAQELAPLAPVTKQPNILWIITDDQRADSIAAFNRSQIGSAESELGYVSSPNIDKLASEGVMFTRAYTNSPACAPARVSMVTGLYPHQGGRYGFEYSHNQHALQSKPVPLALKDQGYQTALFGKRGIRLKELANGRLGKSYQLYDFEVDYQHDLGKNSLAGYYKSTDWSGGKKGSVKENYIFPDGRVVSIDEKDINSSKNTIDKELNILRAYTRSQNNLILGGVNPQGVDGTLDAHIVKAFTTHLANPNAKYDTEYNTQLMGPDTSKPQMFNIGFHFPHTPVLPPKEFRDRFKNRHYKIPDFSKKELEKLPPQMVNFYKKLKIDEMSEVEKQQAIADYYAFCAYGDYLMGQAIDAFKQYNEKIGQDYLIVLTVGDHGWHLGEQGIEAKFTAWNTSNQGMAIVVDSTQQRFPQGKVVNDFVEYVDFAPTMLTAAGVDIKAQKLRLSGMDLAQIIRKPELKRDYVIGEINVIAGPRAYLRSDDFAFSMRVRKENSFPGKGFKPGENLDWAIKSSAKAIEMTLYDLRCDAKEQNNVAYDQGYEKIAAFYRKKLSDIVLGDGRLEVDWNKPNTYYLSEFAKGAHDHKLTGLEKLAKPQCVKL